MGWLNVGSLLFGLLALGLPIVSIVQKNRLDYDRKVIFSFISLGLCAASITLQLFYQNYLVKIEDWAAVMDTMGAATSMAALLLISNISLNLFAMYVSFRKINTETDV